jgi:hypothetical protein
LPVGCRTAKNVQPGETASLTKTEAQRFESLRRQSLQYEALSARVQIELAITSGKAFGSRASLKIRRNERIQLSVQPFLGIEAFRVELSPDSVLVIDRLHKRYVAESFDRFRENTKTAFNFYNLQALFTNRLFLPGDPDVPEHASGRYRWKTDENGYTLQTQDRAGWQYIFSAGSDEKLLASEIADTESHLSLHWAYADFQPVGAQLFPMKVKAGLSAGEETRASLSVNYSHVDTDVAVDIHSAPPAGYERVTFEQIKKMFEQP